MSVINGNSSKSVSPIWRGGGSHTHKNNYYLSGIQGIFSINTIAGDTVFYKTSESEEDMTTEKVIMKLNSYIEANEDGVNTTGWCKWTIGDSNLPTLNPNIEWNGTEWINV